MKKKRSAGRSTYYTAPFCRFFAGYYHISNLIFFLFSSLDTGKVGVEGVRPGVRQVGRRHKWGQHLREAHPDPGIRVGTEQRIHLRTHVCCQAGQVAGSQVSSSFPRN
jgi:hypothetical protein